MKIRLAKIKDVDKILDLVRESADYHKKFDEEMFTWNSRVEETKRKELEKEIRGKDYCLLVAEEKNDILGYILGIVKKEGKLIYGVVGDMAVTKENRRSGLGSRLMKELTKFFKEKKCKYLRLHVFENNRTAIKAYKKYGFEKHISIMEKEL